MSTRNLILDEIEDQLKDKLHSSYSDNYTSDVADVHRGNHHWDVLVNRPCVGFHLIGDDLDEEVFADTGTDQVRILLIEVYGYVDVTLDDYDVLHSLVRDLEYFFKYDLSYSAIIGTVIGNIDTIEAGINSPVSYFNMEIQLKYMNEI